jgi:anti-anti-sigma factor
LAGLFRIDREQADVMIFSHQVRDGSDAMRLVLSGEIDLSVREELRSVLAGVVTAFPGATDVDLHEVTFLDCSGIGEFIRAYIEAHGRGHTLTVSRPRGNVRRILELSDVLAVLAPEHARYVLTTSGDDVPLPVQARPQRDRRYSSRPSPPAPPTPHDDQDARADERDRMGASRQWAADAREHAAAVDAVADEGEQFADFGSGISRRR